VVPSGLTVPQQCGGVAAVPGVVAGSEQSVQPEDQVHPRAAGEGVQQVHGGLWGGGTGSFTAVQVLQLYYSFTGVRLCNEKAVVQALSSVVPLEGPVGPLWVPGLITMMTSCDLWKYIPTTQSRYLCTGLFCTSPAGLLSSGSAAAGSSPSSAGPPARPAAAARHRTHLTEQVLLIIYSFREGMCTEPRPHQDLMMTSP